MASKSGFAYKHRFTVKDDAAEGGQRTFDVESGVVQVVRWERLNQRAFVSNGEIAISSMMFTGWAAAAVKQLIKERAKFDDFVTKELLDWEMLGDDASTEAGEAAEAGPTRSDQQAETSSVSPS